MQAEMVHQRMAEVDVGSGRSEGQLTDHKRSMRKLGRDTREEELAATLLDALDLGEVLG
jgi:hypothetical protein